MDPPSFSNSKKMIGILDLQRDHPWMIHQCMKLLSPRGDLFFSNNLRSFKLDDSLRDWYSIENISNKTIPDDFRNKKIHQCWIIKAKE
jgi:23S rRNA (cytosine1962-C5)-methyltransferase